MMTRKLLLLGWFLSLLPLLMAGAADGAAKAELPTTTPESFQIRNGKFGDLLRPQNANHADGTPIVLYPAESWKCMTWKLIPAGENAFWVQNHFTAKTFHVKPGDAGQTVTQTAWAQEPQERRRWHFTKLADGTYRISTSESGAALTAIKSEGGAVRITAAKWEDKPEQKWKLEKIDPATLTM